jgi:Helix-turn-helix domain
MTKPIYSIKEACTVLGVSEATIYRLAAAGGIKIKKILSKSVIEAGELQRLIADAPDAVEAGYIRPTKPSTPEAGALVTVPQSPVHATPSQQ